jgi:hypothetical protein
MIITCFIIGRSWYFQRKKIQSPKVDENIDFSANSITMNMGPYIIEERLDLVRSNQRILSFLSGVKTIFDFVIEVIFQFRNLFVLTELCMTFDIGWSDSSSNFIR